MTSLQFTIREAIIKDVGCYRRTFPGKHHVQRCTKRIYVERGLETLALVIVKLLHWRISRSTTGHLAARLGLAIVIILLRQPEIYQYRVARASQHYIRRLHVEVQHVVAVHVGYSLGHLLKVTQSLLLGQCSLFLDICVEAAAVAIFHDVVRRAVGVKHVKHTHYAGILQIAQLRSLSRKFGTILLHKLPIGWTGDIGSTRAVVKVAHEKFFYSHSNVGLQLTKRTHHGCLCSSKIGYSERPLTQHSINAIAVFSPMQYGTFRQMFVKLRHNDID